MPRFVGQDGILRRGGNPPVAPIARGTLRVARGLPSRPTSASSLHFPPERLGTRCCGAPAEWRYYS